jgi:hypothetical protein
VRERGSDAPTFTFSRRSITFFILRLYIRLKSVSAAFYGTAKVCTVKSEKAEEEEAAGRFMEFARTRAFPSGGPEVRAATIIYTNQHSSASLLPLDLTTLDCTI